jgi:UDP-glucose 4-epimerase
MSGVVLVTGGSGYIASHVSKALAESGFTPVCYDTLEKGHAWAVRWGPLEHGDIGNAARLEEVFARHKPRAIVHMAGYIEVGESGRQPDRDLHNNATKSEVLVGAAVRHGVDAFVRGEGCSNKQSHLSTRLGAFSP